MSKQKLVLKLRIPADVVMSHFCYEYAYSLLVKLDRLVIDNKVFVCGYEAAYPDGMNETTEIAGCVISALAGQVSYNLSGTTTHMTRKQFDAFYRVAQEFLDIFKAQ